VVEPAYPPSAVKFTVNFTRVALAGQLKVTAPEADAPGAIVPRFSGVPDATVPERIAVHSDVAVRNKCLFGAPFFGRQEAVLGNARDHFFIESQPESFLHLYARGGSLGIDGERHGYAAVQLCGSDFRRNRQVAHALVLRLLEANLPRPRIGDFLAAIHHRHQRPEPPRPRSHRTVRENRAGRRTDYEPRFRRPLVPLELLHRDRMLEQHMLPELGLPAPEVAVHQVYFAQHHKPLVIHPKRPPFQPELGMLPPRPVHRAPGLVVGGIVGLDYRTRDADTREDHLFLAHRAGARQVVLELRIGHEPDAREGAAVALRIGLGKSAAPVLPDHVFALVPEYMAHAAERVAQPPKVGSAVSDGQGFLLRPGGGRVLRSRPIGPAVGHVGHQFETLHLAVRLHHAIQAGRMDPRGVLSGGGQG